MPTFRCQPVRSADAGSGAAARPVAVALDAAARGQVDAALAHARAGRHKEAAETLVGVLRRDNRMVDVWRALAPVLETLGRGRDALVAWENVAALAPADAAAWLKLSVGYRGMEQFDAALRAAHKALAAGGGVPAHQAAGLALVLAGRPAEAAEAFRAGFEAAPTNAALLLNWLNSLVEVRAFAEAEQALEANAAVAEGDPSIDYVAGVIYRHRGRLREAALAYLRAMAAAMEADGAMVREGLTPDGALSPACRRLLENAPAEQVTAPAFSELAAVLAVFGAFDDAMMLTGRAAATSARAARKNSELFIVNYHPDLTAEEIRAVYADFDARTPAPASPPVVPAERRTADRPLRVGYVSPDFRGHSCAQFIEPVVHAHDPAAVEAVAYAELSAPDEATARIRPAFSQWRDTLGVSDAAFGDMVREDRIDILVDLAGHTTGNRLQAMARKPAPVQASWIGYCYTTGLSAIDYYIGDTVSSPVGCEHLFSEAVARLPFVLGCYRPPPGTPDVVPTPARQAGHVTFGCLSRAIRVNDRVIAAWAEILHQVPGSRMVLNSRHFGDAFLRDLTIRRFAEHGIAAERLDIGFTRGAWALYNQIDILLDCFPHNSGTTTFEAFWMGVPVVTVTDRPSVGRLGASVANTIGHPELVGYSVREYIAIAVRLANDVDALDSLRQSLRPAIAASPIMDAARFTRTLEAAYRGMWSRYLSGRPARSFAVAEPRA
ncbi:Tetratricopeptide TPR_2 repeat protein [Caenispirillum salinarum AK4]|uniref:Tetratricopeptide TPR_2 repeat protein n=1 Tax=Caenispirillum salinarum AK4 TaxID=1238182 RepID=K9HCQ5_9PROT|nr:Tetratricopeptide TPR_2 repeat protein [Caenispirillum salinarum]EKV26536.1 Tetratricopeptide TPR_2 repeat protein [Caenispirillum salinarum AK4]